MTKPDLVLDVFLLAQDRQDSSVPIAVFDGASLAYHLDREIQLVQGETVLQLALMIDARHLGTLRANDLAHLTDHALIEVAHRIIIDIDATMKPLFMPPDFLTAYGRICLAGACELSKDRPSRERHILRLMHDQLAVLQARGDDAECERLASLLARSGPAAIAALGNKLRMALVARPNAQDPQGAVLPRLRVRPAL